VLIDRSAFIDRDRDGVFKKKEKSSLARYTSAFTDNFFIFIYICTEKRGFIESTNI
jgi:hypothetical protein